MQIIYGSLQRSLDVFVHNRRRLLLVLHVAATSNFNLQLQQLVGGSRKSKPEVTSTQLRSQSSRRVRHCVVVE
ncbi:hypothetical protein [Nostoc sp. ChiQUE01b]|uniref:hypothetical protein n=1 Tax=Nostoc sp. ChiQUE01b TaxID=3075376 RepID=UPI002AD282B2|nr:hypothetical protein [Nostoc sp. ChiQUE01b]MDZ8260640.1 hypothetical protein [Nostoc sp. ChiQUE01b]